jgi:drug/metabolite transporter (DMT)-like permease
MRAGSKPAWLQILATLILTGCASGISMGLGQAIQLTPVSVTAVWAGGLAAPMAVAAAVGLSRSGRHSAWWFLVATVVIYVGAGLFAGAFVHQPSVPAIPVMALSPLVYPVAGLVWGGLLYQAASQGYLAFLGSRAGDD